MNAYELADEQAFKVGELSMWTRNHTAKMLRQQADQLDKVIPQLVKANGLIENLRIRIAELDRTLAIMEGEYPEPTIFAKITEFNSLEEAYNRIAELEKENKAMAEAFEDCGTAVEEANKPVAWITPDNLELLKNEYGETVSVHNNQDYTYEIPLYTHTVKQLSNEEIANIWAEHTKVAGTYDVKDIIFPFARAIIKEITE